MLGILASPFRQEDFECPLAGEFHGKVGFTALGYQMYFVKYAMIFVLSSI